MNSKRVYLVLILLVGLLLIGLVAGAYGVNKLLAKKAVELTQLKAKSQALDQEKVSLTKAKSDIKKYAELEKIAQSVVPEDKNQAAAVREIVKIAESNNVKLASITFPASTLGSGPAGASTPRPAPAAGGGSKSSGKLSQLEAVKNIPGVYQMVITVNGDSNQPVQYNKFISFLDDLEHNRRTALVSNITIQPNPTNRNLLSFSLTLNQYIKP